MRNDSTVQNRTSAQTRRLKCITTKLPSICTFAYEVIRIPYIVQSSEVTFEHEHEPNG